MTPTNRFSVVGIDDSAASRAALNWAADYARTTGDRLRAIHVIATEPYHGWSPGYSAMVYLTEPESLEHREAPIRQLFASVEPERDWTLEFRHGPVGPTLVEHAAAAQLLIVGTHEHVGLDRMISGSVSHHCLNRSRCPVVAIPPAKPQPTSTTTSTVHRPAVRA